MKRILRLGTAVALALGVGGAALADSTTIVHKTGTVIAKYDGKIVIKAEDGSTREFKPAPGKTVPVNGVPTAYADLKVGTVLTADFVKTTKHVSVKTTEIKEATVLKVAGSRLFVQSAEGFKAYDVPADFFFLVDGEEVSLDKIMPGMKLTATIVSKSTTTVTEEQVKNASAVAPEPKKAVEAPAPKKAAVAPPPPARAAAAPAPAPEPAAPVAETKPKKLPKTASPFPLAAVAGALSLVAGLGLRAARRSS